MTSPLAGREAHLATGEPPSLGARLTVGEVHDASRAARVALVAAAAVAISIDRAAR